MVEVEEEATSVERSSGPSREPAEMFYGDSPCENNIDEGNTSLRVETIAPATRSLEAVSRDAEEATARAQQPLCKRKYVILLSLVFFTCVIAVGVGVGVSLSKQSDDTASQEPTEPPMVPRDPALLLEIRIAFQQEEWSTVTTWLDPTSPQSKALDLVTQEYYDLYENRYGSDPSAPNATAILASMLLSTDPNRWQQRYGLWVFVFTTGLPEDSMPSEECSWAGHIQCSDDGVAIRSVIFDNLGLKGTLPEEVRLWSKLESFRAQRNLLVGALPLSIYNMPYLRVLDFENNALSFSLPSDIGLMSSLERLNLDFTDVFGDLPLTMKNLTQLKEIRLQGVQDVSGPLFQLMMAWPDIESVFIGGILTDSTLTGTIPNDLSRLSRLRLFDVLDSAFHGTIPTQLGTMSQLERFNIGSGARRQQKLSGPVPSQIGDNCQNLVSLVITSNDISGTLPPSLGNCTNLGLFGVFDSKVNGTIPESYLALKKVEDIYLDKNNLSGNIPSEFGALEKLTTLALNGNDFENDEIPPELCSIRFLYYDCDMSCSCCQESCTA